jgi:hypothetical protein
MQNRTTFNQLFSLVRNHLTPFIGQLDKYSKTMNCTQLAKILLYAQVTWKDSLRDIETGLQANSGKLHHMGIKTHARSTIAYRNNKTDSQLFEQSFYSIVQHYKQLCIGMNTPLWIPTVALDSSLVSLALSQYDWALHRTTKWWIRLHVGIDVVDCIPRFAVIKPANKPDNQIAHEIIETWHLRKWEMMVFDRYYVDFTLWKKIDDSWAFFVSRSKTNTDYTVFESNHVYEPWITQDATIELTGAQWVKQYHKTLRLVKYYDAEWEKIYTYITNNFDLPASTIAKIYLYRWKIEEFFRWIKQNLKIKSFLGTSENAVMNQIWIAMIYYVLLHYLRSTARLWKQQLLKMSRLLKEKCMNVIGISEIFVLCRSKNHWCLSQALAPPDSLFSL